MTKITRATRLDKLEDNRLVALAKQEQRTPSAMMRILLKEALNQRECSAAIRQADKPEIDMRFCSPYCGHLSAGSCFNSAAVDARNADWICLKRAADTGKPIRDEHCPYDEADFRWWQQGAVEDALAS